MNKVNKNIKWENKKKTVIIKMTVYSITRSKKKIVLLVLIKFVIYTNIFVVRNLITLIVVVACLSETTLMMRNKQINE